MEIESIYNLKPKEDVDQQKMEGIKVNTLQNYN